MYLVIFIFVKIPYEGSIDLSSKFVILDKATNKPIENESNKIKEILEELSFISDEDVSISDSFDYLDYFLFIYDEREERIVETSKLFLKEIIITRFKFSRKILSNAYNRRNNEL